MLKIASGPLILSETLAQGNTWKRMVGITLAYAGLGQLEQTMLTRRHIDSK